MKKLLFLIILLQNHINCDDINIYGRRRIINLKPSKDGSINTINIFRWEDPTKKDRETNAALEKQKKDDEYRNAVLKNSGLFAAGAVIGGLLVTAIITRRFMKSFAKSFTW